MINQLTISPTKPDIQITSHGALTGDVLTVASKIIWVSNKQPVEDLSISNKFLSGNQLPVGDLSSFNEYYDRETGTYWFDVIVKPVTEEVEVVLQTTATLGELEFPIRFNVLLNGPSPIQISPVVFDNDVIRFEVGASEGKLLRYQLSVLAAIGIKDSVRPHWVADKVVPYGFKTAIKNGIDFRYAVMGTAEVNGVRHNWVIKNTLDVKQGSMKLSTVGKNLIGVHITLSGPGSVSVGLPISYELGNSVVGITNSFQNFSHVDNEIYFEFLVADIKDEDILSVQLYLNDTTNQNAPISLSDTLSVARWNNGQDDIDIVLESHTFKKSLQTLRMNVFWKDGTPVTGFKVKNGTPGAEIGGRENHLILSRSYSPDAFKKNTLTLSGEVDLSPFGINKTVPFSESIDVGSDIVPTRIQAGAGTIEKDEIVITLKPRQNNGDLYKDVVVTNFGQGIPILQNYDKSEGILTITASNTAVKVMDERANITIDMDVTADKVYHQSFSGMIKVYIPYSVTVEKPIWRYRKEVVTDQIYLDVVWELRGNDDNYPSVVNLTQLLLNGEAVSDYKVVYNQGFGALTVSVPVKMKQKDLIFISGMVTASGLGNFLNLPAVEARYREPGTATYVGHEFIDSYHVNVEFDIQGWGSVPPYIVQINDDSWDHQKGVKLGKTYSEYNNKTGRLTVTFDIYDIDSPVFEASTTLKFDHSDATVYPISFSFKK